MEHNRLQEMRKRAGLSQKELAERLGITQQTVYYYEHGDRDIKASMLVSMSRALGCTVSELLGLTSSDGIVDARPVGTVRVPIVGHIAAGTPRHAYAQSGEYHDTPPSLVDGRTGCFWLVIAGNSMNRLFPEGALVLVDPGAEVRDGDVAALFVNGDDATVKRVYLEDGGIRLHPESYDPEYRDRVILATDPEAPAVRMIGRVVSYTAPDGWRS